VGLLLVYKSVAGVFVGSLSTDNPSLSFTMLTKVSSALAFASLVAGRTFTVYNACPFTIWPAVFTDLNVGTAVPDVPTGWEAPAWSVKTFSAPG
jgi:hypothetical protein